MSTYKVELPQGFPYAQRIRSGVTVFKDQPYEGELTDDQLEAIKADDFLTLTKAKEAKAETKPDKPEDK